METVGLIGAGKLGLCLALIMEEVGYKVVCYDKNESQRKNISEKSVKTVEPLVEGMLQKSSNLVVASSLKDVYALPMNYVVVLTPSLENGAYDHTAIDSVVEGLLKCNEESPNYDEKVITIVCTVMPMYSQTVQERLSKYNYKVCYSPEFIAQGSIVYGMKNPDMVLIGGESESAKQKVVEVYKRYVTSQPQYSTMSLVESEITKISVNCFLTTKISFANTVGDLVNKAGGDPSAVLNAVGADTRIGKKYLRWGHGFGGPCLPRDNRALCYFANQVGVQNKIGVASDEINVDHLERLVTYVKQKNVDNKPVFFDGVVYKKNTTILEESQQLELAKACAKQGMTVILYDSEVVLNAVEKMFGEKFEYRYTLVGDEQSKFFDLNTYIQ